MKRVSVIIPTYKPQEYIFDCLKSLEKQSLKNSRFEVIIVLNGEKEPYYSNLRNYLNNNMDFKIIYNEIAGVSNARNLALETSNFEYVIFLDDDDYLSENYLENMLYLAQPNKIVVSNLLCFKYDNFKKKLSKDYISKKFEKNFKKNKKNNLFRLRSFFSNACAKIIFKENIGEIRFDSTFSKGEDSLFMSMLSVNIENIVFSNEKTIYYRRIRNNSASRSKEKLTDILQRRKLLIFKYIQIMTVQKKNYKFHLSRILAQFICGTKEFLKSIST